MKRKKKDEPVKRGEINFKRVEVSIGDETKISIHKEKINSVRVSLGKITVNGEWKTKMKKATNTMTKLRWLGTRAFNDFLIHNIVHHEADIPDRNSLVNIIHACFTIDTNESDKVPKVFRESENFTDWYTKYLEDVYHSQIDKSGLTNVISHAVNEYTVSVVNYITYGLRDQYVRLLKKSLTTIKYVRE